jgi:precorrin-8X/cobalt-precorrin-8 methylmutase
LRARARGDEATLLPAMTPPPSLPTYDYIRDPDEIYRRSFAAIRAEVDLDGVPPDLEAVAVRLIHACGMPDLVRDLAFSRDAAGRGRRALAGGAPILVDTEMVAHGIIRGRLSAANRVLCTLGQEDVRERARRGATTRSAAAVELWLPDLEGAVVAIGNAPTALFRLLELVDAGAPQPAVVLGFPVGFVGAAESKDALADHPAAIPFVTVRGRRGGSAMAAAAVNALAGPER